VVAIPSFFNPDAEASDTAATQFASTAPFATETVANGDAGPAPAPPDPALAVAAGDLDPVAADDLAEPAGAPADALVAVTLRLTAAAEQALQDLAIRRGVSTTQVLGEAIVEKKFFSDQRRNGTEVVLRFADGTLSTVKWVAAHWPLGEPAPGRSQASGVPAASS
jgi:hypothetical protein